MTTNESVSYTLIGWGLLALVLAFSIVTMWSILRADAQTRMPCPAQRDGLPLAGVITTTGGTVDKCLYAFATGTLAPLSSGEGPGVRLQAGEDGAS